MSIPPFVGLFRQNEFLKNKSRFLDYAVSILPFILAQLFVYEYTFLYRFNRSFFRCWIRSFKLSVIPEL